MSDLDRLDDYLSSEESPENCLLLSDLDGFLHAVVCAPEEIAVDEWMRLALGCRPAEAPAWVLECLGNRHSEILDGLLCKPATVEPLFWEDGDGQTIAMDWCEGFMQGVALRPKAWLRLT